MGKKWTITDIKKTGLNTNLNEIKRQSSVLDKKYTIKGKISVEKEAIEKLLWWYKRSKKIEDYVRELQFDDVRLFRFDWAIPYLKIAIEYEGIFSQKSGHTTVSGYTKDCVKYNLAAINGWTVLRYTAKNYTDLESDLKSLLETKKKT